MKEMNPISIPAHPSGIRIPGNNKKAINTDIPAFTVTGTPRYPKTGITARADAIRKKIRAPSRT
jgi:hypothetical protein